MHNANTGVTMGFKYNHDGIRTQKVKKVNGVVTETTDYILKGKQIAAMKKNTDEYYFTYDASGKPATVNFNGTNYTYVKNLQGDIVGILDASGNMVVEYKYDAWGDAVSIYSASTTVDDLAFDNPFRYRGYIWDEETGLYYLRSRYYNPERGRFDNTDTYVISNDNSLFGSNMFAYCLNNPVRRKDISGTTSVDIFDADGNPATDDDLRFEGGRISNGNSNTNGVGKSGSINQSNSARSSVDTFLESHGQDPSKILKCFEGEPSLKTLTEDTVVYRDWGGSSPEYSNWVSPINYGADARSMLSIPSTNSMAYKSTFIVPAGTTVLAGIASPYFNQPGGGIQWWVPHAALQSQK